MNKIVILLACFLFLSLDAAPQVPQAVNGQRYSPFEYQYKVEDAEQKLYHDKTEAGDENGKVCRS